MSRIVVIGSINMDLVSSVESMPKVGQTVLGKGFKQVPGGKGANQAVAISRLGGDVAMVGKVGDDAFGTELLECLVKDKIDVQGVASESGISTGIAIITVDENGDNCIVVNSGANFKVTSDYIDSNMESIKDSSIVVMQLEIPDDAVRHALALAKSLGKYTILNPAPAKELDEETIRNVDLLVPNETELEIISGMKIESLEDAVAAAEKLISMGVREIIVTLGENGSLHVKEGYSKRYEAKKVTAVDTTAAGDSFIGGIAAALSKGKGMEEAIELATSAAAVTVTREGAQSSIPYIHEIEA